MPQVQRSRCKRSRLLATSLLTPLFALAGCGSTGRTIPAAVSTSPAVVVTIAGRSQVRLGGTIQFTASISNASNSTVLWSVQGIAGGTAASGTISTTGLYTPPPVLPTPNTVAITATSAQLTAAYASMQVALLNPSPIIANAQASQVGTNPGVLITVNGSRFASGAQIQSGGTSLPTSVISATELQATVSLPSASAASLSVSVINPDPGSAISQVLNVPIQRMQVSIPAAARLLDQSSFGPTAASLAHVQNLGLDAYLDEQFAKPASHMPDRPATLPAGWDVFTWQMSHWWKAALTGDDQLRQRVAFALSEIFVVSTGPLASEAVIHFSNILANDAFGNFSDLLKDVTLSSAMGTYLNLLNSAKPAPGQIANENFARESMQLFTLGLYQLNPDGSNQLDSSGNPIPTYTQAQIQAFARAYTGWTYPNTDGTVPTYLNPYYTGDWDDPLAAVESMHDTGTKILLNGVTLPAGQSARQDLDGALDNLFQHPNLPPFFCRQLIQHLVTGDPSPAYTARVSAVFVNDGTGQRGNLKAVIRAILLDPEARAGDADPTAQGGHLREPALYLTNVMRGLNFVNIDPDEYYSSVDNQAGSMGQIPYAAPSVFNFFSPHYILPGTNAVAPEFGLENTASVVNRLAVADLLVFNGITGYNVDLSRTGPLGVLAADPVRLIDSLGVTFMHGQMPQDMRAALIAQVSSYDDIQVRLRTAIYLIITSSLYKVQH